MELARENRIVQRGSQKKMSEAPVLLTNVACAGHYKTFQKVCVRKVLRYLWGKSKAVNQRTVNAITKRTSWKRQTVIDKAQHEKLTIKQH